ncbi:MAG: shikimate kinase [Planctomycetaceae bacterium]|jgi:shikimate kinase|nr:shikimate kinase [Planctomycetaceae bacterium]
MQRSIILIGYRGTGKTTIGRTLAKRLSMPFVDSDPIIESRTGKTIAEIFRDDGEKTFRDYEEKVFSDLLQPRRNALVIASGGGAILRENTRALMRKRGEVIWLTADPKTILARIQTDKTTSTRRPDLTNLTQLEEIKTILTARTPLYQNTAHVIIDTESITRAKLVEEIIALL